MEAVAGLLLWVADLSGIKWIRHEKNPVKKMFKTFSFLILGVVMVMLLFVLTT
jgi:hypothetical protein